MTKIIARRILPVIWDRGASQALGSLKVTLTHELLDIGVDPEKEDIEKTLTVELVKGDDGKKRIIIERIENTRGTRNEPVRPKRNG
ncbi:hypothetical protein ACFL6S_00800 [Candidatus Poribacteria bacterium]